MNLKDTISTLSAISAPSGFEAAAADRICELIAPCADETWTDAMGNLTALRRSGVAGARRLVFSAHIDETGLIVTGHENGFLRFARLGGTDPRMLPGSEVRVLSDPPLFGVVCAMPPHALTKQDMESPLSEDKLFIDAGLTQQRAMELVPPGTPCVCASGCTTLGENRLCGKALDNRAGAAVIIKTFEALQGRSLGVDLYALFTVQEELGCRGAGPGVFAIEPDYCVVVDASTAHTPDIPREKSVRQGGGAAIAVGPAMTKRFTERIIDIAVEKCVPYQLEVLPGKSKTDAGAIQINRFGTAAALVSLPVRYLHSPLETLCVSDAAATVNLLTELAIAAGEVL